MPETKLRVMESMQQIMANRQNRESQKPKRFDTEEK